MVTLTRAQGNGTVSSCSFTIAASPRTARIMSSARISSATLVLPPATLRWAVLRESKARARRRGPAETIQLQKAVEGSPSADTVANIVPVPRRSAVCKALLSSSRGGCCMATLIRPRRGSSLPLSVARMRAIVHAALMPERHVGVDTRRVEAFVSEQLLNRHEVRTVLQQMGRKGMSQRVRARFGGDTADLSNAIEYLPNVPGAEALAGVAQEKRVLAGTGAHADVLSQRIRRGAVENDLAGFVALAGDQHRARREVNVREVDRHQFRPPNAAAVEKLHHGLIADS